MLAPAALPGYARPLTTPRAGAPSLPGLSIPPAVSDALRSAASTPGGQAARELARRFERANDALVAAIERYPDELWRAEPRPGAASPVADVLHLAHEHLVLARFVRAVATGEPLPRLKDGSLLPLPARLAQIGKGAAIGLLHEGGAVAAAIIRGLDDAQLGRATSFFGAKLTAAQLVEELMIGHIEEHGAALLARTGRGA